MNEPRELALLSTASRALCEARTVDEVKDIRDKAEAVKAYARKAKLGQSILIEASMIKVSAERKLGSILSETDRATAAPGNQFTGKQQPAPESPPTLESLGITKSDSSRLQQIASLPEQLFQGYLAETAEAKREPTTAGLLRLVKQQSKGSHSRPKQPAAPTLPNAAPAKAVADLNVLLGSGERYSSILADPLEITRDLLTFETLCALPVEALVHEQAHLHFWTNPEKLLDALDVMEAWGFEYRHCVACVGYQCDRSHYWHTAHRLMLLGVRGNLPFRDVSKRSWCQFKRNGSNDSETVVRRLVEAVSPAPYLRLFAKEPVAGWTSHVVATQ